MTDGIWRFRGGGSHDARMTTTRVLWIGLTTIALLPACGASTTDPSGSGGGTPATGASSGAPGGDAPAGADAGAVPLPSGSGSGGSSGSSGWSSSGSSGSSGSSSSGGSPDPDAAPQGTDASVSCAASAVTPDQVIFIGDSFIAEPTSDIAPDLESLWQKAGSPGYSATPRYYQFVGTDMKQISAQYDSAHSANPNIKVVVGNGGGNDVLVDDRSCLTQAPPANTTCTATVAGALSIADTMIGRMESDGVEHFLMFFYPHEPTQGLFQGTAPAINDSLDYAEPLVRGVCEKHSICTFVSFRAAMGEVPGDGYIDPNGYIKPKDVHPSTAGSQFFAATVWQAMKNACILTP